MKRNIILLILFLFIMSCDKEEKINNDININFIRVYRNDILVEEYTYDDYNRLLKVTSYKNDGGYYDSCVYKYDGNTIDYMLKYWSSSHSSQYEFVYVDNLLSQIQSDITYSIFYIGQRIKKVELTGKGYSYDYLYNYDSNNNVEMFRYAFPLGIEVDSMKYDNKINPFSKLFHYEIKDTRYISTNNIIYHKHYRKELIPSDLEEINYRVTEEIKHFQYEYDEEFMPKTMIEFNQTTNDTVNYRFEYE